MASKRREEQRLSRAKDPERITAKGFFRRLFQHRGGWTKSVGPNECYTCRELDREYVHDYRTCEFWQRKHGPYQPNQPKGENASRERVPKEKSGKEESPRRASQ